jgi:agmatinase
MRTVGVKHNFLGLESDYSKFDTSAVVIHPVPYERTVSYGGGTRNGPAAILQASHYVEFYDEETERELHREKGIATLPPLQPGNMKDEAFLEKLHSKTADMMAEDKFVVTLGGEHTITSACVSAHAKKFPNLTVLQIDAHSDLRGEYDGSKYSHACVMARITDFLSPHRIVQVGIRAQAIEEAEFIKTQGVHTYYAHGIRQGQYTRLLKEWDDFVVEDTTENVYITFDVDGLDPSIMPSTGTPEPNGLHWEEIMRCIRKIAQKRRIVGFDVVELAPMKGVHHPDLLTARLVMKILNYAL